MNEMNEEFVDVEDVNVEDIVDGSGHPVLTIVASLLGGAVIGTGGKLLFDKFVNNDEKKLKRKERKLEKLRRDAQKLGIDLDGLEVEIPTDEELEELGKVDVEETETEEVKEKPKKGGKKK